MTEHTKNRWKNRRSMAWIALLAGALFPLLILATDSKTLADIAMPFYTFVLAVVSVYTGASTYDDVKTLTKD
jgi:uncharacterized membrane protein